MIRKVPFERPGRVLVLGELVKILQIMIRRPLYIYRERMFVRSTRPSDTHHDSRHTS